MRSYNSYDDYRQYRKNKRRYGIEAGAIPALIFFVALLKTVSLIRILFIILAIVLFIVMYYKSITIHSDKKTQIDLDSMNDEMFSIYCKRLLSLNQFKNIRSAKKGIDTIGEKDGFVYGIKCIIKQNEELVDADTVRLALNGSKYYYCDKTIIITNRHFSNNTIKLAEDFGVLLWNRKCLIELLQKDSCAKVYHANEQVPK